MKTRDQLHRHFLQSRNSADWENYKVVRNKTKEMIKDAERNYTAAEVELHKNNPSSMWKIINRAIPSKDQERHVYSRDPKTVADEFNQFFRPME